MHTYVKWRRQKAIPEAIKNSFMVFCWNWKQYICMYVLTITNNKYSSAQINWIKDFSYRILWKSISKHKITIRFDTKTGYYKNTIHTEYFHLFTSLCIYLWHLEASVSLRHPQNKFSTCCIQMVSYSLVSRRQKSNSFTNQLVSVGFCCLL